MESYYTPTFLIQVDEDLCGNAILCLKCVKACLDYGPNLIGFVNKDIPPVGEEAPKTLQEIDHRINPGSMILCDGCEKCVRACPKEALTLVRPEPREPAAQVERGSITFCSKLRNGEKVYPK